MSDQRTPRDFTPPVRAVEGGFELVLDREERALLERLLDELSALLTSDAEEHRALLSKLFPTAYPDDDEKEDEYQRLMREELVASRLAAIGVMLGALRADDGERLDEPSTIAFMQSLNAVRLVLGTMLGISDDDSADDADDNESPEHQLYTFLSWLLEWTVQALTPAG
ncbi:MAG: DUF2017 family protein [Acidimicrobiia bacterium]|nr:DUF2017 family protein [Acidimicrobiia bacterium]